MYEEEREINKRILQVIVGGVGALVLFFLVFAAGRIFAPESSLSPTPIEQSTKEAISILSVGDTEVKVEIVEIEEEQRRGLSDKDSLDIDKGMLFVYKYPVVPSFWMKGMRFPIDIIWILEGKVVGIRENVPVSEEGIEDSSLPRYSPNSTITAVLEVNAGFAAENKIKAGDSVEFYGLEPSL